MDLFGFSKKDITPEIGCLLYGYVDDLKSESIHDRLSVNAFYFEGKNCSAFLISAEVCSINTLFSEKIRREISKMTGVKYESIIIHGIHNHSGPNTDGNTGWGDLDINYCESILLPKTIEACIEAKALKQPALVGISIGESLVAVNRREQTVDNYIDFGQCPWGSFDPRMAVFSFRSTDGNLLANLIYYTCHGTTAGCSNEISRDFAGGMIDTLEKYTKAPAAFFCGPEGDVGPRLDNGKTVGSIRDTEIMGKRAGNDAVRIFDEIKEYLPLEVKVCFNDVSLPLKKRIPLSVVSEMYEKFKDKTVNLEGQKKHYCERLMASYNEGYEDKESLVFTQTAFSIGSCIFAAFPYELFSDIGNRIDRAYKDFNVFCLSNANGSEGYFPCDSEISKGGYEIDMFLTHNLQPYCDHADFHLIKETMKNLEELICIE